MRLAASPAGTSAGLADGVAIYEALRRIRPDIWFIANSDAIRWAKGLGETKPSGARASRVNGLPGGPYPADGEDSKSFGPAPGKPNPGSKSNKGY